MEKENMHIATRSSILHPEANEKRCDRSSCPDSAENEFDSVTGNNADSFETKDFNNSSVLDAIPSLPLLNSSPPKYGRHRSQDREKYLDINSEALPTTTISRGNDDNQTAHLSHNTRATYDLFAGNQAKAKRWASAIEEFSPGIDESLLPHLVVKPVVPSPQKLNPRLQRAHLRRTWNGSMRPQADTEDSRSTYITQLRRPSSVDTTLATFEATETILIAEIDFDERCANFLRQRAPREALMSHPDVEDPSRSQIRYKLRALDRKIMMNKEKLVQVRERIADLGGKPTILTPEEPDQSSHLATKPKEFAHNSADIGQQSITIRNTLPTKKVFLSAAMAALVIQCAIRAFQARRCLADLLGNTYQRILSPSDNQYFYYNRITRLSQWEAPTLLRRCYCSLDNTIPAHANPTTNNDPALDAAAKIIQTTIRQHALRVFLRDLKLGNLEKVFDAGFGAWYYFNSRTNRSFWESVHHVQHTSKSAIYHRHPSR